MDEAGAPKIGEWSRAGVWSEFFEHIPHRLLLQVHPWEAQKGGSVGKKRTLLFVIIGGFEAFLRGEKIEWDDENCLIVCKLIRPDLKAKKNFLGVAHKNTEVIWCTCTLRPIVSACCLRFVDGMSALKGGGSNWV